MEFIDKYNVIKAYDISNVYLPGFILIPCDKYGSEFLYDCDMIYYSKGKVLGYTSDKPLRKIENLSAYYKVVKEVEDTITDIDRFSFRKRLNRIRKEVDERIKSEGGEIKPSIYDRWKADADMYDRKMNNQDNC
ncbi:hypothetical protein [Staphylococcus phage ZCSS1]|uniref:Uncharacterized protein n=1 Tax=Staphylococcus phage UHP46 TaxID=3234966 RepID=A0AB39C894_9CAUD|nr:hypothetical protein [Staphylococcus phage ZCSS1]